MTVQIWSCRCGHERVYGCADLPDIDCRRALLQCGKPCSQQPTMHRFRRTTEQRVWERREDEPCHVM